MGAWHLKLYVWHVQPLGLSRVDAWQSVDCQNQPSKPQVSIRWCQQPYWHWSGASQASQSACSCSRANANDCWRWLSGYPAPSIGPGAVLQAPGRASWGAQLLRSLYLCVRQPGKFDKLPSRGRWKAALLGTSYPVSCSSGRVAGHRGLEAARHGI